MLAGHYATALVARQKVPAGALAYYLIASQLPDLLWLVFHYLGLEPTEPDNPMLVSLDTFAVDMTYSHDLLPMLLWIAVAGVAGRLLFGDWRVGGTGALLVFVHEAVDLLAGFPHHVFGPESLAVGTGLYHSSPYLAVAIEALFSAAMLAWVWRNDRQAGIRRNRRTLIAWAAVFFGGAAFLALNADLSIVEMTGLEPIAALSGLVMPVMIATYLGGIGVLLWAERQPLESGPASA
jgi:hypothetical protein